MKAVVLRGPTAAAALENQSEPLSARWAQRHQRPVDQKRKCPTRHVSVSDISGDNRNSRSQHMKCVFLSGDHVYFWVVCRRPLRTSVWSSQATASSVWPAKQKRSEGDGGVSGDNAGILGNGALWRLGGCCCLLVPIINNNHRRVRQEAQPHFLSLFFAGDSYWVASFIHLVWKKILGVAFTSCFSAARPPKSAETTPLLISSLPVSTVPAPRHDFQSTRSPETDKWQKLPKLHFPNYYFSISLQIPQINAFI